MGVPVSWRNQKWTDMIRAWKHHTIELIIGQRNTSQNYEMWNSNSIRSCSCSCSEHLCLKHLLKGLGLHWLATLALIRLCTGAQQCHVQISKSLCKIIDLRAIDCKHIHVNVLVHHCMFANKWGCHGSKITIQIAGSKSILGFACRLWVTQRHTLWHLWMCSRHP